MKLRNKKTGEIVERIDLVIREEGVVFNTDEQYTSLAELNEEWEDVPEEPKEDGLDNIITLAEAYSNCDSERYPKEIVEKLKAWKRLKDKGISFEVKVIDRKWYLEPKAEPQQRTFDEAHDLLKDVMTIFGGEE